MGFSGGDDKIVVYLDLLFIENVMMDSFLLLFVSLFLRQSTTFFRILQASVAGGIYCCVFTAWTLSPKMSLLKERFYMLGTIQSIASTIISYVLLCMLMIFLAFGIHNKHILMKNIAVLYGAALFTGGVFQFLGNLVKPLNDRFYNSQKSMTQSGHVWAWICLILFTGITFMAALLLIRERYRGKNLSGHLYDICLEFGKNKIFLKALLDTGNQLYEPNRGRPVTIIEKSAIDEVFECTEFMKRPEDLLYVPYQSIGKKNGLLTAVVADLLLIKKDNTVSQYVHAVIGIYPGHIHREYRAILHPDMVYGACNLYTGKKIFHL